MSTTPRITSITSSVTDPTTGTQRSLEPRDIEVSELKIKTLKVNMSNGLIIAGEPVGVTGVVDPAPYAIPKANAQGRLDAWILAPTAWTYR